MTNRIVKSVDIGAKVIRGQDWNHANQDSDMAGNRLTGVITGAVSTDGWCNVKWSNGYSNSYAIGDEINEPDKYDLYYAEEEILNSKKPTIENKIVTDADYGSRVVRGKDWGWDNQDCDTKGNQLTGVISSHTDDGWVTVTWSNGVTKGYRIGANGKYDLYYAENQIEKQSVKILNRKKQITFKTPIVSEESVNILKAR